MLIDRSLNIPDAYQDPRFDQRSDQRTGFKYVLSCLSFLAFDVVLPALFLSLFPFVLAALAFPHPCEATIGHCAYFGSCSTDRVVLAPLSWQDALDSDSARHRPARRLRCRDSGELPLGSLCGICSCLDDRAVFVGLAL